jgi:hypothetical protein
MSDKTCGHTGWCSCSTVNAALDEKRKDRAFIDRLATRMREDKNLLRRIAEDNPSRPRREQLEKRIYYALLRRALGNLPLGLYVGANRYDTDEHHVLHLWTEDGRSFDVTWSWDEFEPADKGGSDGRRPDGG